MTEETDNKIIKTQLRMPAKLQAELERAAKESGRSMNAEIVHHIKIGLSFGNRKLPNGKSLIEEVRELGGHIESVPESILPADVIEGYGKKLGDTGRRSRVAANAISALVDAELELAEEIERLSLIVKKATGQDVVEQVAKRHAKQQQDAIEAIGKIAKRKGKAK